MLDVIFGVTLTDHCSDIDIPILGLEVDILGELKLIIGAAGEAWTEFGGYGLLDGVITRVGSSLSYSFRHSLIAPTSYGSPTPC